ncbi:related to AP-3 complex subunit delta [Saccharomycodes ludwigii]|uniref:AP-3 complex subunit delta n=1 Tax=Saccharomycodes ludwigii TaxID=36035 RepID=A0A376B686_9ASCO|nr:hypothetical protein SCDLUD_001088 [Saccharomycodes ludwigii]KAH3903448.1 hypothetical protein SCDLUD_001088 [Saccharomycodes ludwigii]SSD60193.1 related to AP-3 complex subunit delta [Saccharomycodes ludwigii]
MSFSDSRLRPFGIFFEKSLKDLINGIRSHNHNAHELHGFLTKSVSECREEVKSPDMTIKTNSILKLSYLEMYGFDMSWADFYVLEVMSSNDFQQKRVGYLAAQQVFHEDSDMLMLATNCLKKDLSNANALKVGIALNGISSIISPNLARDISKDLIKMLRHSKPYIRKKTVASLFKLFLQYPEALRDDFEAFVEKLHDEDTSVVSATVSVICELCKINPQPFMKLLPLFYDMLIEIDNNWIIIRLLKLFTTFCKQEPKLRLKLLPKVLNLIEKTTATSLIYESINCIVKGGMLTADDVDTAVQILELLTKFCASDDPNLRYVSCVLFYYIGKINTAFIYSFDKLVIELLEDVDISIRSKALELLEGIVNEDNLIEITSKLLKQVAIEEEDYTSTVSGISYKITIPIDYKIKIIKSLLYLFSLNDYENISLFEWYITILGDMCDMVLYLKTSIGASNNNVYSKEISGLGVLVGKHLRNVAVKVPEMRDQVVLAIIKIISNSNIYSELSSILVNLFWTLGEFSSLIDNGNDLIRVLISDKEGLVVKLSPVDLKTLFVCLLKVYSNWVNASNTGHTAERNLEEVQKLCKELIEFYEKFSVSVDFEVQERSTQIIEFLKLSFEALEVLNNKGSEEETSGEGQEHQLPGKIELPFLVSDVLPGFFNSWELVPIKQGTQLKLQKKMDLDTSVPFLTAEEIAELDENDVENSFYEDIDDDYNSEVKDQYETSDSDIMDENPYPKKNNKLSKEKIDNPFYLQDDDDDDADGDNAIKERDLLDMNDNTSDTIQTNLDRIQKNKSALLLDTNNSNSGINIQVSRPGRNIDNVSTTQSKKKSKAKKKKIKIISDSTLYNDELEDKLFVNTSSITDKTHRPKNGIDLNLKTNLKNFDFSKPFTTKIGDDEYIEEEDIDINQLRKQFENLKNNDDSMNFKDGEEEEVIIIKKKKKKNNNKKKTNSGKSKKKSKKSVAIIDKEDE